MEEGVGFEPTEAYKTSLVFKTKAINHSANLPFNSKDARFNSYINNILSRQICPRKRKSRIDLLTSC